MSESWNPGDIRSAIRHLRDLVEQDCVRREWARRKLRVSPVVRSIAQSLQAHRLMMSGAAKTKTELAELTGNSTAYMSMIASLCTLSPDIISMKCSTIGGHYTEITASAGCTSGDRALQGARSY